MRALIAEPHTEKRRTVERRLRELGCEVRTACDTAQAFRLALGPERPSLIVISTDWSTDDGLSLCGDIRRRHVSETQPQIVLRGANRSEQQLLEGLRVGANDWVESLDSRALAHHVRAAAAVSLSTTDAVLIEFLRTLTVWDSGVLSVEGGGLRGRVEIARGQLARVALEPTARRFEALIQSSIRQSSPEVEVWLRAQGDAPRNFQKALVDAGFWERARLRESLQNSFRHNLRVLCRLTDKRSFEPRAVDAAPELSFAPEELLADDLPKNYKNPRTSFLAADRDNEVCKAEVS